ncbi:hypothetical protein [Cyclobacterium sp. SYSU L10401]|uniref:hypothetical protein n=1 Tax=Cyclobacterium sp. SYSU L10401 TaxID=2678657 RepID=UPI0013D61655|nr:hypothetical protein [Cyclobacterium sp. SYSU L10401]
MMISTKQLKEKLKERIDGLSEDKLRHIEAYLESLESRNKKGELLTFAGAWGDLDDETFNEFTTHLKERRKSDRARFFDETSFD